ncbi:MAG: response regulator [Chitinophagaceae bacterium]|nr:response regulator [Chitinophagaceae bacterium]
MYNAPVFIIDDDQEELDIIQEIWKDLDFENPLEVFTQPEDLFKRLADKVNPFLILSDVKLPKMDGFALREKLGKDTELAYKSIPFVFWSTAASNDQIKKSYDSGGHGFFIKGDNYIQIKESIALIMSYWKTSKVPTITI